MPGVWGKAPIMPWKLLPIAKSPQKSPTLTGFTLERPASSAQRLERHPRSLQRNNHNDKLNRNGEHGETQWVIQNLTHLEFVNMKNKRHDNPRRKKRRGVTLVCVKQVCMVCNRSMRCVMKMKGEKGWGKIFFSQAARAYLAPNRLWSQNCQKFEQCMSKHMSLFTGGSVNTFVIFTSR